jgi:hypothetical protein
MSFLSEFWDYLKVRKKLWLMPVLLVVMMLGGLLVLTEGSAVMPFVYAVF